jgi:hypothetical protein
MAKVAPGQIVESTTEARAGETGGGSIVRLRRMTIRGSGMFLRTCSLPSGGEIGITDDVGWGGCV